MQPDGRTRVLGYTRKVGNGGVTYFALGPLPQPCHPRGSPEPADNTPRIFRGAWESDAFIALLRNSIAWGADVDGQRSHPN